MDAINKFTGLKPTISPEQQETLVTPEQAPTQVSSPGIAATPDAFEAFSRQHLTSLLQQLLR